VIHLAGHYNLSYGMYGRIRARAFADWSLGDWTASWRIRYIGPFDNGSADDRQGSSADAACLHDPVTGAPNPYCAVELHYGATVYHAVTVAYALPNINSRVEVGVDNLFDKQPPLLYQNNVLNANTDVNTFDTAGRFFFARYTVKF
jgi:iron complex outermembrane receptor protein